jgi:hypothetical protein
VVCEGVGGGSVVSADSVAKVVIGLMGSWDAAAPSGAAVVATAPPPKVTAPPAKTPAKTAPAKPKRKG